MGNLSPLALQGEPTAAVQGNFTTHQCIIIFWQ